MLIDSIKRSEGFSGTVYTDTEGFDTIGFGTKLPITEDEASLILNSRLTDKIVELQEAKPIVKDLPQEAQDVLYEMAYQIGVGGLLKFKKMWKALENRDYYIAAQEMLDSKWAIQTPNRAIRLAGKMRELA